MAVAVVASAAVARSALSAVAASRQRRRFSFPSGSRGSLLTVVSSSDKPIDVGPDGPSVRTFGELFTGKPEPDPRTYLGKLGYPPINSVGNLPKAKPRVRLS